MNKYFIAFVLAHVTLVSCGKKEKTKTTIYSEQINGVLLTDVNNQNMGSLGEPDVKLEDNAGKLYVFPKPSSDLLNLEFRNKLTTNVAYDLKIVTAQYKDAPADVSVENLTDAGSNIVLKIELTALADNPKFLALDLSRLSQGFYRLKIEKEGIPIYWDNIWVKR